MMKESNELMVGGKNVTWAAHNAPTDVAWKTTDTDFAPVMGSEVELLEELKMMKDEDVIEGMEERSLEDIIKEVAEEENLTEEEVRQMIEKFQKTKFSVAKSATKPKKVKNKNAIKQAKKSKKKNRKR